MIKLGWKLGGVTPAPLVLRVTNAKDDDFKCLSVHSLYTVEPEASRRSKTP